MTNQEQATAGPSIKYIKWAGGLSIVDCAFLLIVLSDQSRDLNLTLMWLTTSVLITIGLLGYNSRVAAVAMTLFGIMRSMIELVSDSAAGRTPMFGWEAILAVSGVVAAVQAFRLHRWKAKVSSRNEFRVPDRQGEPGVTRTTPIPTANISAPPSTLVPAPKEAKGGAGVPHSPSARNRGAQQDGGADAGDPQTDRAAMLLPPGEDGVAEPGPPLQQERIDSPQDDASIHLRGVSSSPFTILSTSDLFKMIESSVLNHEGVRQVLNVLKSRGIEVSNPEQIRKNFG